MGDLKATGKVPTPTSAPAAGQVDKENGEAPPPPADSPPTPKPSEVAEPKKVDEPKKDAGVEQEEVPQTEEHLVYGGALAPPPPPPKPEPPSDRPTVKAPHTQLTYAIPHPGGARKPTERPDEPNHAEGHLGKVPGPDATRDEYLAYLKSLLEQHTYLLSSSFTGSRTGTVQLQVRLRANGSVVWISVIKSSGFSDIDKRAQQAVEAMGQLPPPPNYFQVKDTLPLILTLPFPAPNG